MNLSPFLAEVRVRKTTAIPSNLDAIGIILARIAVNRLSVESRALRKACLGVITMEGDMDESDLWALGADALGLLDAFAADRLRARYQAQDLEMIVGRLQAMARA